MNETSAPAERLDKPDLTFAPRAVEKTAGELKQSQDLITPNHRQQRKIINYLTSVDLIPKQ